LSIDFFKIPQKSISEKELWPAASDKDENAKIERSKIDA